MIPVDACEAFFNEHQRLNELTDKHEKIIFDTFILALCLPIYGTSAEQARNHRDQHGQYDYCPL